MKDITKIIEGLEQCTLDANAETYETQCYDCPYYDPDITVKECVQALKDDACESLKRSEPVKPEIEGSGVTWWHVCGNCHTGINPNAKYCHQCGRAVKWDG